MPPGKPSYSRSGRPVKAQKSEAGLMAKNLGYTHWPLSGFALLFVHG
jgi:hypothetical protein